MTPAHAVPRPRRTVQLEPASLTHMVRPETGLPLPLSSASHWSMLSRTSSRLISGSSLDGSQSSSSPSASSFSVTGAPRNDLRDGSSPPGAGGRDGARARLDELLSLPGAEDGGGAASQLPAQEVGDAICWRLGPAEATYPW